MMTRGRWNEIQRDAYDPDDEPKTYYCKLCHHKHRYQSKIGMLHNPNIPLWLKEYYIKKWNQTLPDYNTLSQTVIEEGDK